MSNLYSGIFSYEKSEEIFGSPSEEEISLYEEPDPDSLVICHVGEGSELLLQMDKSTPLFYSVTTEYGIEGFCKRSEILLLD